MIHSQELADVINAMHKRLNPENRDYDLRNNDDINALRELRNAFSDEVSKYQKMIDDAIFASNDVHKYKNKYVKIYNPKVGSLIYMHVTSIGRASYGVIFRGPSVRLFDYNNTYDFKDLEFSISEEDEDIINFVDIENVVTVLDEETWKVDVTNLITHINQHILQKNIFNFCKKEE